MANPACLYDFALLNCPRIAFFPNFDTQTCFFVMKKFLSAISALLMLISDHAQYPLEKGRTQLNAGLGFSAWGIPVYAGFDFGIHKDMSVGIEFSYRRFSEKIRSDFYNHSITGIGFNWNYHFNSVLKLDYPWNIYAGLNAGYYIWNSPNIYPGKNVNGTGLGGQLGFRYYFSKTVAFNAEGGSGTAFRGSKLGITIIL